MIKPEPPSTGSPDRTARKGGVQFHGVKSLTGSITDCKDGAGDLIVDCAGPRDHLRRPKTPKDVGGAMHARAPALLTSHVHARVLFTYCC